MNKLYQEIKELVLSDMSKDELLYNLSDYHDSDIADVLEQLTETERINIYNKLGIEKVSEIFAYYENVEDYIEEVTPSVAADIIQEMDSNDALDVLNELDLEDKEEIINLMEEESKEEVLHLDSYNEDEIGSYMSDNYIVLSINDTILSATSKTIKKAGEHDNLYTLYVVDDNNEYRGAINIKDLFVARKNDSFKDLIIESYPFFYDKELISDCIEKLKDYAEDSIPILNDKNEILGVITSDTVIEMTEEELVEDYAKLAGLSEEEQMDEKVFSSVKKRIPWLAILLVLGLFVSMVLGLFDGVISSIPSIVFFQSVILGMSGNGGTQSLTVTIRNISSGASRKKILKSIIKEIGIGIINGLILGVISFFVVMILLSLKKQEVISGNGYIFTDVIKVSLIVSISLVVAMTLSNLIGTMFPILLNKIHIDPAVASGPFITTINDIIAIIIYYGLTYLIFIAYF